LDLVGDIARAGANIPRFYIEDMVLAMLSLVALYTDPRCRKIQ
jgi:hypothetical protein